MVYHLKNWKFMRDMMCSDPQFVVQDMIEILEKKLHIIVPERNRREIDNIVRNCSCVQTQEGLEACLNGSREDMAPRWSGKTGESPEFELLLEELDKKMEQTLTDFFEKHLV